MAICRKWNSWKFCSFDDDMLARVSRIDFVEEIKIKEINNFEEAKKLSPDIL